MQGIGYGPASPGAVALRQASLPVCPQLSGSTVLRRLQDAGLRSQRRGGAQTSSPPGKAVARALGCLLILCMMGLCR